ncbi:hypothetical protein [Methylococcus sp. EFPC2]|uniref:hypothetical protein n=1 Tax=Methylococcus sp. EFPC2 TaxID=2812648 RepID=UPI0019677B42|nr:hypothetical protein [Methylococcus sp. EFPC2]QSA98824.1 hypothetical protein JWZ97_08620 [Methylococcus sp. EFPC2]
MADNPTPAYRTLSWLRQGLLAGIADPASAGRLTLPMRLTVNGSRVVETPLQICAPGDVTGIDAREVIRTDPHSGAADFEPNYFPLIEFDRPDFPWLFTPAAADGDGRLRPWIALVVVRQDRATLASGADRPLPVLECPLEELPDLAESWAWAHAEVVAGSAALDPATLKQVLKEQPERTLSRLLCPRRLDPATRYLACLVPTYEVGRLAGLGEAIGADQEQELTPAWPASLAAATVRLPVYFHWEFGTGADGDFEALARRLVPREPPPTVGLRPLDVSDPGWSMPKTPSAELDLGGALETPKTAPRPWQEPERGAFQQALRAVLDRTAEPALLAPPLYGQGHTDLQAVPAADTTPRWFAELNLDPRHRVAAGLGALVIRYEQEPLMAAAWDQLARHEADAQRAKRAQLAETVGAGLRDRQASAGPGPAVSLAVADAADSAAYRRLTRSRGPLAKRLERLGGEAGAGAPSAALRALAAPSSPEDIPATELPRFAPEFPQPMYEPMRDYFPDALLPGMDQVPANTVALLKTNQAFIEAYLAGLNHELSRELLWRGYPADPKGSYFRRFWDRRGAGGERRDDMTELRSWKPAGGLGEHGASAAGELVLLIRGDLLRRYPRAVVYAVEAVWSADGQRRELGDTERHPLFRAGQPLDVTLLGFPLTAPEARGADAPAGGHPGWFFVLQEQPTEPRFGLDAAADFGGQPAHWADLAWGHLAPDAAALQRIVHVSLAGPLAGLELDGLPWGRNSAHMAAITRQRPFRVAIHARTWLPGAA